MTMAHERTRALIFAFEYLSERKRAQGLTVEDRRELDVVLRHYPTPREIKAQAKIMQSEKNLIFGPWLGNLPDAKSA